MNRQSANPPVWAVLSMQDDPDSYDKGFLHCDLLVIGAGPAGLSAALAAGRSGARVILADEDFAPGGRLNAETLEVDGMSGADWAAAGNRRAKRHGQRAPDDPHDRLRRL